MHRILWGVLAVGLSLAPQQAEAKFVLETSVGKGFSIKPDVAATPSTIMVAPGWGLGSMLRLHVGFLTAFGDAEDARLDFQIRPMLVIDPPVLPIYGRFIMAFINLREHQEFAYGGAIGVGGSLGPIGLFGEFGIIPVGEAAIILAEARAGVYFSF